jgi:hypothetical protein
VLTIHRRSSARVPIGGIVVYCALLMAAPLPASAQGRTARFDVFGGFSLLPADGNDFPRRTSSGVQVSVARRLTDRMSLVLDIGAHTNTARDLGPNFPGAVAKTSVYELLAGPRFTRSRERLDLFAHALAGWAVGRSSLPGFADNAFALGGGGGVDVRLTPRVAIRAQIDVLGSFVDILETNTRVGAGLVFRFGG